MCLEFSTCTSDTEKQRVRNVSTTQEKDGNQRLGKAIDFKRQAPLRSFDDLSRMSSLHDLLSFCRQKKQCCAPVLHARMADKEAKRKK